MPSTFQDMKNSVERGWDIVLWSESYGPGDFAVLAACVYLGCAQAYLGQRLEDLVKKVGADAVKQALSNKGKIFGAGEFEVSAGDAYWSTYIKVWNPFKRRHEKITVDRYIRLYVRMRRKHREGFTAFTPSPEYQEYTHLPDYSGGPVYPVGYDGRLQL
ncbi:hypothetical protein [Paenibacillus chitinolyticus]|uniref:hypothetical protein n=1 Tax=Paenibacillus chitinolyticus TaxID=79263 RepID=UPI00363F2AA3